MTYLCSSILSLLNFIQVVPQQLVKWILNVMYEQTLDIILWPTANLHITRWRSWKTNVLWLSSVVVAIMLRLIYCTSGNATIPMVVIFYMITNFLLGTYIKYFGGHYSDVHAYSIKGRYQWWKYLRKHDSEQFKVWYIFYRSLDHPHCKLVICIFMMCVSMHHALTLQYLYREWWQEGAG